MGGDDKNKQGRVETYVGNNYGFGGNKFDGKFNINLPGGINVPSGSTPPPPNPPQPPPNADIDTYVGNNFGFGGNKFDGNYDINIGGQKETPPPRKIDPPPPPPPCKQDPPICQPQPCHTAGRSTYCSPNGGMQTSCPVCADIWARNNSMSNYQALLRGDHIYS